MPSQMFICESTRVKNKNVKNEKEDFYQNQIMKIQI